jgi:hypothetical protein
MIGGRFRAEAVGLSVVTTAVTRTVATAAAAIIRRVAEKFVRFLCDEILYFPCKVQLLCPGAVGRKVNLVVP